MTIIEKAIQLAVQAHKDQVRKTDGTPYIAHPLMVARLLDKHGFDDIVIAAAVTHDVLEDTDVTKDMLRAALGDEVCEIVVGVTENTKNKGLSWEERKSEYIKTVSGSSVGVKAVSVGDKIHNLESLIDGYTEQGSCVWQKFNRGKEKKLWFEKTLLEALQENWKHPLLDEYERLLKIVEEFDD